jgi:signal transduction histidine kinase
MINLFEFKKGRQIERLLPNSKRRVKLTRTFLLFNFFANALFMLNDVLIGKDMGIIELDIFVVLFYLLLHIYYVNTNNQKVAAILLTVSCNLWLLFNSSYYGKDSWIFLFFFTLELMTFFLYDLHNRKFFIAMLAIPICCIVFLELGFYNVFTNYALNKNEIEETRLMSVFCNATLFVIFINSIVKTTFENDVSLMLQRSNLAEANKKLLELNTLKESYNAKLQTELVKAIDALSQKQVEVEKAIFLGEENERKRIASELHDRLGALLSTIRLKLYEIESDKNHELNKLIDIACTEVRNVSNNLHPILFSELGLIKSLASLCSYINQSGAVLFNLIINGYEKQLDTDKELVLYRIIMELIQNIIKHAQASEAIIQFIISENILTVSIEDNGIGFNKNNYKKGVGLISISNRLKLINADWYFDTSNNKGVVHFIKILL